MTQSEDQGLIEALIKRLPFRLERAQGLKARVDAGELLNDNDIQFLERVFRDAREVGPLVDKHPEYQELAAKMVALYHQITTKALENQRSSGS